MNPVSALFGTLEVAFGQAGMVQFLAPRAKPYWKPPGPVIHAISLQGICLSETSPALPQFQNQKVIRVPTMLWYPPNLTRTHYHVI